VGPATLGEAEVLAAALREGAGAKVVGSTTFGKGFNQESIPLPGGASLRLSTRELKTAKGTRIEGEGVEPDVPVEYDPEGEGDDALAEAVRALEPEEPAAEEEAA
jgi:carboxyl-terminal processing protease